VLAAVAFHLECGLDFLGGISGVKFVEQVLFGKGAKSSKKAGIYANLRLDGSQKA